MGNVIKENVEFVISHFEGSAGNFLGRLISGVDINTADAFRIDQQFNRAVYSLNGTINFEENLKYMTGQKVVVCHQFDKSLISSVFPAAQHIPLWPYAKQLNVIWNISFKKRELQPNVNMRDLDFYHLVIKEWHQKLKAQAPDYQCYRYEMLSDLNYVESIIGTTLSNDQHTFFCNYWKNQLSLDLTWPLIPMTMQEIIQWYNIEHSLSPWFAALAIYTYEEINQIPESSRQWSINDIDISTWDSIKRLGSAYAS